MNTKRNIYVVKAIMPPIVTNLALWAKDGKLPSAVGIVVAAIVAECLWQGINALGAYYSTPPNGNGGQKQPLPPEISQQPEIKT